MITPTYIPGADAPTLQAAFEQAREIAQESPVGVCKIAFASGARGGLMVFAEDTFEGFATESRVLEPKSATNPPRAVTTTKSMPPLTTTN